MTPLHMRNGTFRNHAAVEKFISVHFTAEQRNIPQKITRASTNVSIYPLEVLSNRNHLKDFVLGEFEWNNL